MATPWTVALCLSTLAVLACGKVDQNRSWDGANDAFNLEDGRPAQGIYAVWRGVLKDKRDDADAKIMATTFTLNKDKTFLLTLDDIPSAGAGGSYIQFQDSILFTIRKSSLSIFGLTGAKRDMNYSLFGKTMIIFDKQIEFKLEAGDQDAPQADEALPESTSLLGKWQGQDQKGNSWLLTLTNDRLFTARVENVSSSPLHLAGSFEQNPDRPEESARLLITQTNNESTADMTLQTELVQANTRLKVTVLVPDTDGGSREVQNFTMRRL